MPAKKKLNGDLLTSEEMQSPMGLGYVSAAERLGLIYLYELKVIAQLLVDYANVTAGRCPHDGKHQLPPQG